MLKYFANEKGGQPSNNRKVKFSGSEMKAMLSALNKSQAIIQFSPDGAVLGANENFLSVMGCKLEEIVDRKHSMFVEPGYKDTPDYKIFWMVLGRGEYQAAEYKRIGKGGCFSI
ncbi:MAG: PAS domain-containing protein [Sneathiella sp.]|nr:PAS domain-containing protein [Sneathiella sp.]